MKQRALPTFLIARLPFYYGWVVLACACLAAIARGGPAVATLSIFVEPMTRELEWSRTALSGAVSLGGILAAISSPAIGSLFDRIGARMILAIAVISTGVTLMLLSQIHSLWAFYALFCIARLNFAGPFDLGINGAVSNWFIRHRAFAISIVTVTQMVGLFLVPLIGHLAMQQGGWRMGWLVIGALVLVVGFLPSWLLMVRRPEDVGLLPDGDHNSTSGTAGGAAAGVKPEPQFTRSEALRTRAFWMLGIYTAMVYPVQAGVSLHQAAHLLERGLNATATVATVSMFSLTSAVAGVAFGVLLRWMSVRMALVLAALTMAVAATAMTAVTTATHAIAAAMLFGVGIGGLHTILPVAWADYFGRRNFGAIRGVALTIQVAAQATGPLLSGILRDWSGDYVTSLISFAGFAGLACIAALFIRAPAFVTRT